MELIIIAILLFSCMGIGYIVFRQEEREELKAELYIFRHKYDAGKQQATDEINAAFAEFTAQGLIK